MKLEDRIRKIYERRPYPPVSLREKKDRWVLPQVEWIEAVREPPVPQVSRILVAGCGVGSEAFAFAQRFPSAEVVGVDFSPRSITTARRLRGRHQVGERVRFELADLNNDSLREITGGQFDLVSCHGVMSYMREPVRVLRNLRQCMLPTGALVLGVNGAAHPSVRFRSELPAFGFEPEEFRESKELRAVLGLFDSISRYPPVDLATQFAGYLASDLFGPLIHNLPLAEWARMCRKAGLYLRGGTDAGLGIRAVINRGQLGLLMPRSRGEVSELVDALQPGSFHRIVLSRRRSVEPPWLDGRSLLSWRPYATRLFAIRWPSGTGKSHNLRNVTLESKATNTKVTLRIPQWEVEILRHSDGEKTLKEIMERVTPRVAPRVLGEQVYMLHQLGALNLVETVATTSKRHHESQNGAVPLHF